MVRKKGVGRGWHGDSAGHAAAGRKGGLASRRKREVQKTEEPMMM